MKVVLASQINPKSLETLVASTSPRTDPGLHMTKWHNVGEQEEDCWDGAFRRVVIDQGVPLAFCAASLQRPGYLELLIASDDYVHAELRHTAFLVDPADLLKANLRSSNPGLVLSVDCFAWQQEHPNSRAAFSLLASHLYRFFLGNNIESAVIIIDENFVDLAVDAGFKPVTGKSVGGLQVCSAVSSKAGDQEPVFSLCGKLLTNRFADHQVLNVTEYQRMCLRLFFEFCFDSSSISQSISKSFLESSWRTIRKAQLPDRLLDLSLNIVRPTPTDLMVIETLLGGLIRRSSVKTSNLLTWKSRIR